MPNQEYIKIISFYRFINVKNKKLLKFKLEKFLKQFLIRGTILLSNEGINGSLTGSRNDLEKTILFLKKNLKIKKLNLKINNINFFPFNRLKVRLKKEIVSMGQGKLDVDKLRGKLIKPELWDELISHKSTKLIDVRNIYEIEIGKFKNAKNPNTENFRQFPNSIKELKLNKNDTIAMYCTGGIRCEKASSYLKNIGFKNIHQLEGGIINYLEYKKKSKKKSKWTGECFVFDNRVTVNSKLKHGKYIQCYACRSPISAADAKLKSYTKGISCKYCIDTISTKKKKSLVDRQRQIELNHKRNDLHLFK